MVLLFHDLYIAGIALAAAIIVSGIIWFTNRIRRAHTLRPITALPAVLLILGSATLTGYAVWKSIEIDYYMDAIEECDGKSPDDDPQWAMDALVRMDGRAIDPLIEHIRGSGPFYRGTCLLPMVLVRLGQPAHQSLLQAIDSTSNEYDRIGWIYALCEEFHDYSRLDLWIQYAIRNNRESVELRNLVIHRHPDAPEMFNQQGVVSADFVNWFDKHRSNPRP